MRPVNYLLLILAFLFLVTSCSGKGNGPANITSPSVGQLRESDDNAGTRMLWGMWQISGDMRTGKFDIVPQRRGMAHLNALAFMEPPPNALLKVQGGVHINGDVIDVDIALTHPFPAQPTFTGFDVKGIIITKANDNRFPGPLVTMANEDATHLMNPDGYTLWWSPFIFPPDAQWPNQGYIDGLLGTPNEVAQYESNVNAYKYFSDDLGPNENIANLDVASRGMFSAGKTNVRHYKIKVVGNEFLFNYAVDASWAWPKFIPPFDVPEDFPPHANQPEAYRVDVAEVKNTLYYDGYFGGGDLVLDVTVHTWRDPSTTLCVFAEAPSVFSYVFSYDPIETGDGWVKYRLNATTCTCRKTGQLFVLIGVQTSLVKITANNYGRNTPLTAYFPYITSVGAAAPTDGIPGTPRGLHPGTFEMMPKPPGMIWLDYNGGVSVRGDHIVIPFWANSYSSGMYSVAESLDGGKTFTEIPFVTTGGVGEIIEMRTMIDSSDGVHFFAVGGSYYYQTSGVYVYKPYGGSPQTPVYPFSPAYQKRSPMCTTLLMDGDKNLHLLYKVGETEVSYYPLLVHEITTANFSDFSEPLEICSLPYTTGGWLDERGVGPSIELADDGEIFIAYSAHDGSVNGYDIYFSHGFPGSMTEFVNISNDSWEYLYYPSIRLEGKESYVTWQRMQNKGFYIDCSISTVNAAYIPYGETGTLKYLTYPSLILEGYEACSNSGNIPAVKVISSVGSATGLWGINAPVIKTFTASSDLNSNLITYTSYDGLNLAPDTMATLTDSGIVTMRLHGGDPHTYYFSFSEFDFY